MNWAADAKTETHDAKLELLEVFNEEDFNI